MVFVPVFTSNSVPHVHFFRRIFCVFRWDNEAEGGSGNQIAFGRNGAAFIAYNYEDGGVMTRDFQTGMPAGTYCDIISGNPTSDGCSGNSVTVDGGGWATISIDASSDDPIVAFHTGELTVKYTLENT